MGKKSTAVCAQRKRIRPLDPSHTEQEDDAQNTGQRGQA